MLRLKQNKWRKEIGSGVKLTFDSYFFIFFRGRVLSRQKERGVPATLSSFFFFFCARSSAGVFYAFACCPTFLSRLRVLSEQRGARKPTTAFFVGNVMVEWVELVPKGAPPCGILYRQQFLFVFPCALCACRLDPAPRLAGSIVSELS